MTSADEIVALAGKLFITHSNSAAALRTVVSRAYYGAYHATGDYFVELGLSRGRQHNYHFDLLNCNQSEARLAGQVLEDLRSRRVIADYELEDERVEDRAFAQYAVVSARKIQSLLERLHQEPLRTTVKAGIEAYRQRIGPRG